MQELKKRKYIYLIICFLIIISFIAYFIYHSKKDNNEIKQMKIANVSAKEIEQPIIPEIEKEFYVEIKGAVKNPGVYKVTEKNIINDLLKLSGGLNKDAYTNNINLSMELKKEMVIFVYTNAEIKEKKKIEEIKTCPCETYQIDDCTNNKISIIIPKEENNSIKPEKESEKLNEEQNETHKKEVIEESNKLINLNTATLEELMSLSGIGEEKAKSIIEYREKTIFKSIDEIKNVRGIGDAIFDKIKTSITI